MKIHTLQERAAFYSAAYPKFPPLRADNRWLDGVWFLGNDYKGSGFYGSYPPGYLKRIFALFPDRQNVLHLFSGPLEINEGVRFDIRADLKPDLQGDAHTLSKHVKRGQFDLILADPPYSIEDAEHYGQPMINRNSVVKECAAILKPGAFLVWLDQILPMYRKDCFRHVGAIGIVRSTNHRFRMVSIFERV